MKSPKTQRIRDTVHNLIEFDDRPFEQMCWKVLNTRPLQRLRRIKQLGFSEFVYPGASHTRFAHSIGVFHTSRQLASVVRKRLGDEKYDGDEARLAMAAALVHDVGHGPFSHAFEEALKRLKIAKRHELRTKQILEETDVIEAFEEFSGFPKRIGELIESSYPKDIYASLISSQFDADRLDYMRRDRLMTGTQQSGIDYEWLIANLKVHKIPIETDGEYIGKADALVIDDKSIVAAEGYIFSLLYLYINVYFHKTTRGIEKLFSSLIELLATRIRDGACGTTGLPRNHPIVAFLKNPEALEPFLQLDDAAIMGSLSMLADAKDKPISELARRIRDRKIYNCVDVGKTMASSFGLPKEGKAGAKDERERAAAIAQRVARVGELAIERGLLEFGSHGLPGILEDTAPRSPYKRVADGSQAFARIHVIGPNGQLHDLADMSPAVNALGDFKAYRLYSRDESDHKAVQQLIRDASS